MRFPMIMAAAAAVLLTAGCLAGPAEEESGAPEFLDIDPCSLYQLTLHWQDNPDVEQIVSDLEAEEYTVVAVSEDHYIIEPVYDGVIGHIFLDVDEAAFDNGRLAQQDAANQTQADGNQTQAGDDGARNIILQLRETGQSESHRGLVQAAADDIASIVTNNMEGEALVHSYDTEIEVC